ncbi:MAG: class I SAM-dependent methyltransferase [Chloroflexota bacterium]
MTADRWLDRWLPLIQKRVGPLPLLELGCGPGWDTTVLVENGIDVFAVDLSAKRIAQAQELVPKAHFYCQDIRDAFPQQENGFNVVLASLSLHYFAWEETAVIVSRIHQVLQPHGILLCRLNSTKDTNYGAVGYPEIDTNFYLVRGRQKRFFDEAAVQRLFQAGWKQRSLEEMTIGRFGRPKVVWEVVLEKEA